jgi:hypothetical protein
VGSVVLEFGSGLRMAARNREQQKKCQEESATENIFSLSCGDKVSGVRHIAKISADEFGAWGIRCSVSRSGQLVC